MKDVIKKEQRVVKIIRQKDVRKSELLDYNTIRHRLYVINQLGDIEGMMKRDHVVHIANKKQFFVPS